MLLYFTHFVNECDGVDEQWFIGYRNEFEQVASDFDFLYPAFVSPEGGHFARNIDWLIGPRKGQYFTCHGAEKQSFQAPAQLNARDLFEFEAAQTLEVNWANKIKLWAKGKDHNTSFFIINDCSHWLLGWAGLICIFVQVISAQQTRSYKILIALLLHRFVTFVVNDCHDAI